MDKADYWKSQGRKFCDFCKCWIADNKPSIDFHEGGKKHKENVSKRLKEIHKNSAKQAKQNKKFENDLQKMENAAMAAYLRDVENNTRDMTADIIIKEKNNRMGSQNLNAIPVGTIPTRTTVPRPKEKTQRQFHEIDPCDPTSTRRTLTSSKVQLAVENRAQLKGKTGKGKGKGKKSHDDDCRKVQIRKLWYEARSSEGYKYYWHIETNESVWEPPDEGYMTLKEQEEEAKEQALQEKLFEQIDQEQAVEKNIILQEQRANAEREKLKERRKRNIQQRDEGTSKDPENEVTSLEEEIPYRRDYSVPERSQPYGTWQTVQIIKKKPIDLQLPEKKNTELPVFEKAEHSHHQRTFVEKTITQLKVENSDDEEIPTIFKKRKFGSKNVRRRTSDD